MKKKNHRVWCILLAMVMLAGLFQLDRSAYAKNTPAEDLLRLPSYYKSPHLTDVRDQHSLDWCMNFALVASIESNLVKKGYADSNIDLSETWSAYWQVHPYEDPKEANQRYYYYTDIYAAEDIADIKGREQANGVNYDYEVTLLDQHYYGPVKNIVGSVIRYGLVTEDKAPLGRSEPQRYTADNRGRITTELNPHIPSVTPADSTVQLNDFFFVGNTEQNRDIIKRLIMEHGSGEMTFNIQWDAFGVTGQGKGSLYLPKGSGVLGMSHTVQLVGWDDNYAKDNFTITPPDDGAWIVKNSWGKYAANTDIGYNYISYYSDIRSLYTGDPFMFSDATICGQSDFYDNRYAYGSYELPAFSASPQTMAFGMANIYTIKTREGVNREKLRAVALETGSDDVSYTLRIYRNPKNSPTDGTLIYEQPVTMNHRGYYRLPLDDRYRQGGDNGTFADGDKISVVMLSRQSQMVYYSGAPYDGISADPTYKTVLTHPENSSTEKVNLVYQGRIRSYNRRSNQSYLLSATGQAELMRKGNVHLDIFTDDIPTNPMTGISVTKAPDKTTYLEGESFSTQGMVVTATYSDGTSTDVTGYTISPSGALASSDTTVTISYTEGGVTQKTTQAIMVNKHVDPTKFTDVPADAWYKAAVDYVAEKGLMQGTTEDKFSPGVTTTRAMIVTILHRLEGEPAVSGANPFGDVADGQWYTAAIIWASSKGIVEGYGNGKFGPKDIITREQFAAIMYRYANVKGYDTKKAADLSGYEDIADVSEWAIPAMKWANAENLITGRTATTLVPKAKANRAEAAAILMRFIESIK